MLFLLVAIRGGTFVDPLITRLLGAAMLVVGLLLAGSVAGATRIRSFAEGQLFADPVVWWEQ